jgi:starch-binding outer membrane protein, SusD/RagB family
MMNDVVAYHEIMGDVIGVEAANVYINQLGMPDWVTLDNGTKVNNPANPNTQLGLLRFANQNSFADQNPVVYEWAYMYALNNICNSILGNVETIPFTGDAESKKNTLKAWAHWWKGYAYSRIGSMYYAGLITSEVGKTNNVYVTKEEIIAEAQRNFDSALTEINAITSSTEYTTLMTKLIPSIFQVGLGSVPTSAMWIRNINTMKARNILVNKRVNQMSTTEWDQILTLTANGINPTDNIFLGRSNATADFMSATSGSVALVAAADPTSATYKISERLIQDYKAGDKRLMNNFGSVTGGSWLGNADRGNVFNTRYRLLNNTSGTGPAGAGVISYANRTAGLGVFYFAASYEENELMKAEANIYKGSLASGIASIDAVRTFQGAGLPPTVAATDAIAKEELRKERRVGLVFRGLSFYDARRWGILDPVSTGGGRSKAVVVDRTGTVNVNATINYGYLDYWDVPDNELVYNIPAPGSAPVKNPK